MIEVDVKTTEVDVQEPVNQDGAGEPAVDTQVVEPITSVVIDGLGEISFEDIKEFKQGYMRQSDYTKKTQDIATQRKEIEVLRTQTNSIPEPANVIPEKVNDDRTTRVERELENMKLDLELKDLKLRYPDFNEIEVLNKASELGVNNLEFVYQGLKGGVEMVVDKDALKAEIMAELKANASGTETIITNGDTTIVENQASLTPQEAAIADKMGISYEDYIKYKS